MDQLAIHGNHRGDLNHPLFSLALWGGGRGRCQSGYYNNNDHIKPYIKNFNSNGLMNKSNIQTNELIRGRFCIT